jgi:hypothetical protein
LIRFHVAILDEQRFYLSYAFHHAILDGWSESVFAAELIETYAARRRGLDISLEPAAPFAEFVRLERESLKDEQSRAYFIELVKGASRVAATRRAGKPVYTKASVRLAPHIATQLEARAATLNLPVKTLVIAAYYRTMADHFGVASPVVGLSVHGRPELPGADRTLGLFLNHLPLRLPASNHDWAGLARSVFAAELEMLPHRRFPYSEIRKLAGGAPFEVALSYVHFRFRNRLLSMGLIRAEEDTRDHTSLPIRVEAINDSGGDGFLLDVSVDVTLYSESLATELAGRLATALESLVQETG